MGKIDDGLTQASPSFSSPVHGASRGSGSRPGVDAGFAGPSPIHSAAPFTGLLAVRL